MAAPPTIIPCEPWTTPDEVRECCVGLDPAYDLTDSITFATEILFRLSGRQFPGECERTIYPCFPAGTLVTTIDGPRPIEDVRAGDLVLTHEGRWREVEWSRQTGHAEIVRVKGQGGTLRATADHPVWAREVKPMDWSERKVKLGAPEWRDASELVGYAWATPKSIEALPVPEPPHEGTPAFWRMVGRWIGDGWTQTTESQAAQVFICCGNHEADDLEAELTATGLTWVRSQERTTTRFRTSNRDLRDWLRAEFGSSATDKRLPGWVLGLPEATRQTILDGYVAADGSTRYEGRGEDKRVRTRCSSVSRPLAVSIRMLAVSLGYPATLVECEQQGTEIEGRKVNAQPVIYEVSWLDGPTRATWQDDDHLWARVRSVELESELQVPVYNIEVAEDHSYVAEGIVVHNCKGDNCGCDRPNWWALLNASDWIWGVVPSPGHPPAWPIPTGDGSGFVNCKVQGSCQGKCTLDCLDLPGTINEITEVVIDGEVIPPQNYKIKAYRELCWVGRFLDQNGDIRSSWPCSNNLGGTSCVNTDREDSATVDATGGQWEIEVTTIDPDTLLPITDSVAVGATDSAAVVQAAVEGLSNVGAGAVAVSGGPGDAGGTTPYVFVWDVVAIGQVPVAVFSDVSLVGGASTVAQAIVTEGCLADPGTWHITYNYGKPVPAGGRIAAAIFACQIALNRCGGSGCILPQRVKSITRQGVDMLFADPLEFLDAFQTGIYEVDLWLASVNPNKLQRRARVFRADKGPGNATFTG